MSQVIRRKAPDRADQNGKQRDILHRVVKHPQIGQGHGYLRRAEKRARRIRPGGNSHFPQLRGVNAAVSVCVADQHTEIPVSRGALFSAVLHKFPIAHHGSDQAADIFRLQGIHIRPLGKGQDMKLRIRLLPLRVRSAGRQFFLPGVLHLAHFHRHKLTEHKIHPVGDTVPAAEVSIQIHLGGILIFFGVIVRITGLSP